MESRVVFTIDPSATSASSQWDLAAQADDRIANNLSLIASLARMRAAEACNEPLKMDSGRVRLILEEFASWLDAAARLHRLLANGKGARSVGIASYLGAIATGIVSSLPDAREIDLEIGPDSGHRVSLDVALALGLIVSELVTNAVKYAHPAKISGKIRLECEAGANGGVRIEVSDDGVGLPDCFDGAKSGEFGLRMVRLLAERIGATIEFKSDELGLRVALRTPASGERTEPSGADEPDAASSNVLGFPSAARTRL
jgi:two-component sensor histidine kinase